MSDNYINLNNAPKGYEYHRSNSTSELERWYKVSQNGKDLLTYCDGSWVVSEWLISSLENDILFVKNPFNDVGLLTDMIIKRINNLSGDRSLDNKIWDNAPEWASMYGVMKDVTLVNYYANDEFFSSDNYPEEKIKFGENMHYHRIDFTCLKTRPKKPTQDKITIRVNWDAAPEGATDYKEGFAFPWLKLEGDSYFCFYAGDWYYTILDENFISSLISKPTNINDEDYHKSMKGLGFGVVGIPGVGDVKLRVDKAWSEPPEVNKVRPIYTEEMRNSGRLPPIGCAVYYVKNDGFITVDLMDEWSDGDELEVVAWGRTKDNEVNDIAIVRHESGMSISLDSALYTPIKTKTNKEIAFEEFMLSSKNLDNAERLIKSFNAGFDCAIK